MQKSAVVTIIRLKSGRAALPSEKRNVLAWTNTSAFVQRLKKVAMRRRLDRRPDNLSACEAPMEIALSLPRLSQTRPPLRSLPLPSPPNAINNLDALTRWAATPARHESRPHARFRVWTQKSFDRDCTTRQLEKGLFSPNADIPSVGGARLHFLDKSKLSLATHEHIRDRLAARKVATRHGCDRRGIASSARKAALGSILDSGLDYHKVGR